MVNLYCVTCKHYTAMDYDSKCHNFICSNCDKLLVGKYGHEILEFDDAGHLELYVTKDTFIFLIQNNFLKSLMEIYGNRVWISTEQ